METKKSTVKKVKQVTSFTHGDDVWWRWGVVMENGDSGFYHTKTEEQGDFTEGKEVEYLWEPDQYEDKDGNQTVGKIKKPQKTSQRHYMASLKGEEYIETLKAEIRERTKQAMMDVVMKIPGLAASYAKDICANKGDFVKSEIMKDNEDNPGLYSQLYDIISRKMYNDLDNMVKTMNRMMDKMEEDDG
jgi:hypothetical protein